MIKSYQYDVPARAVHVALSFNNNGKIKDVMSYYDGYAALRLKKIDANHSYFENDDLLTKRTATQISGLINNTFKKINSDKKSVR